MTNVVGIFNTEDEASFAYASLLRDRFNQDDISLIASESASKKFFTNNAPTSTLDDQGVGGAVAGMTLGGLAAGLSAAGVLLIPGVNLVAVGPILAAVLGAQAGAVVGGLSGLINAELENEKDTIENAIKAGKVILIVHTDTDLQRDRARLILKDYAATLRAA